VEAGASEYRYQVLPGNQRGAFFSITTLPSFPGGARERVIEAPPLVENGARYEFNPTFHALRDLILHGWVEAGASEYRYQVEPGNQRGAFFSITTLSSFPGGAGERFMEAPPLVENGARYE